MDLMVATYIKQKKSAEGQEGTEDYKGRNNFPYELNVEMKSSLIKEYGLDPQDVKKVLNGVIEQRLQELKAVDKVEFQASEKEIFNEVVALHRLALEVQPGKEITVGKELDK